MCQNPSPEVAQNVEHDENPVVTDQLNKDFNSGNGNTFENLKDKVNLPQVM